MNWDQIEGKWKQFTGSARERWGKLTDDDLQTGEGEAGLEVAMADEGDNDEFGPDDRVGPCECGMDVCDEERKRVQETTNEGHQAGDEAAEDRVAGIRRDGFL